MFKRLGIALLALAALATTLVSADAQAGGNRYRVEARMRTGTPLEAKADYRERLRNNTLLQRFSVEVSGAQAGQAFDVTVNGAPFGQLVANSLGRAEMEFHTAVVDDNPHDEDPPLPTDFPRLNPGDTVSVGSMTGTFRLR